MKFSTFLLTLMILMTTACNPGGKINGHTTKTAYRSVKILKRRLPEAEKIAFEMSFWSIRETSENIDEFLDAVDGKTPEQIITQGKQVFVERQAVGYAAYTKFSNWDEMIKHYVEERKKQSIPRQKYDAKEDHSVLYKFR